MFPGSFTYSRPGSVAEAVAALQANPDAKIIAGGHSLIPAMKLRLAMPGELVDLRDIGELRGVEVSDDAVAVRAMTTYNELRDNDEVAGLMPILPEAIQIIGDAQVRERGTLVGSLVHNDPAADLTAVALALGGSVHAVGSDGERDIPLDEFFVDLWTTTLELDEVVTHASLNRHDGAHMAYRKYAHPASGYAIVGVAVVVEKDGDTVSRARVAVTGATNTATRLTSIEEALAGKPLTEDNVQAAVENAAEELEINGDTFASAEYRAHLVRVLARRALLGTQQ
ncbi:MAG TPA: xanthine dehydrogenase family protein subunit M [Thermomicrobiales bacterium]|nr:xanthine dehydrogenase family protein subunit M [Thermomicrobiales bacterium]